MPPDADERLASDLKEAFARLAGADLDTGDRATLHRRLLAITNAAKHDTARARARLDRWFADVDALSPHVPDR